MCTDILCGAKPQNKTPAKIAGTFDLSVFIKLAALSAD